MNRLRPLLIFVAALAVRLVYVAQIRDLIYFDVPLVDGANYFRSASAIAGGDLLGGRGAFWQPPLYPYFLALLIALFGRRMTAIYTVQAAVGSLSCLLVYFVGRRVFGERAGLLAAAVTVLYGPLVYFDAQPLIPVLHIALTLAGLLLLLRAGGVPGPAASPRRDWCLGGLAWGLSAIATPNILLAVPAAALWARRRARPARRPLALFLIGVCAPIALVTARNAVVARELILISSNGGINFYIGNNPDYRRTTQIRPGGEFERLAQEPENLGILGAGGRSRYFARRAVTFLVSRPGQALRLYGRKALDLIAGREIPRNQEIYAYRRHSPLLAALLWRAGVSFPFGVVAPLALAGALIRPRRGADPARRAPGRPLLLLYAAAYAFSILVLVPTARYRLPLVPVAALLAGNFLAAGPPALRRPAAVAGLVGGLLLFNLDAARPSESWPEEEALNRAFALRARGRLEQARREYRRALELNPGRIDPHNSLAALAAREGRWEEAARHYRAILEIAPDFVEVRRNLGQAYMALGREEDARREWRTAIRLAPGAGLALADLCLSYLDEGLAAVAEPYCARAVRARPDLPETHFALGLVARSLRDRGRARAALREAARLWPAGHPGRRRAEAILEAMRRREAGDG